MAISTIAARAVRTGPRCGSATVIAIDGPAGSGKTTLARRLTERLDAQLLHMDDLYNGWEGLREGGTLLTGMLHEISRGRPARYRRYDWTVGRYLEEHALRPSGTIIAEGVGSVRTEHLGLISTVVMVMEPDPRERLERGLARDGADAREHWERWMDLEGELHAEVDLPRRAHVVIDGHGEVVRS